MDDLYGESHYDSQPFAQALWEVRESLSEWDQQTLDKVVLDSLALIRFQQYSLGFDSVRELNNTRDRARLEEAFPTDSTDPAIAASFSASSTNPM